MYVELHGKIILHVDRYALEGTCSWQILTATWRFALRSLGWTATQSSVATNCVSLETQVCTVPGSFPGFLDHYIKLTDGPWRVHKVYGQFLYNSHKQTLLPNEVVYLNLLCSTSSRECSPNR